MRRKIRYELGICQKKKKKKKNLIGKARNKKQKTEQIYKALLPL